MIRFPISYKRTKGPNTPNFRKLSEMLSNDKLSIKIPIDRESVILEHWGIGIKMNFVCDIMEELQRVGSELKTWRKDKFVYVTKKEFYDFIFELDICIFEMYSILDYLALELTEIFNLKKQGKNRMTKVRYFTDLEKAVGLNAGTRQKVINLVGEDWFKFLHKMRIRVVHRLPINLLGLVHDDVVEFPFLPDEPLEFKSPSKSKLEPLKESKKWLEGVFRFVDEVCFDLGKELFDTF